MNQLRRNIMRRVYYVYALKAAVHPAFTHGLILIVSFFLLTRVVSIPNVWANLMEVRVGDMFNFFLGALLNTKSLTLVLLTIISATALSLLWRLLSGRRALLTMEEGSWA